VLAGLPPAPGQERRRGGADVGRTLMWASGSGRPPRAGPRAASGRARSAGGPGAQELVEDEDRLAPRGQRCRKVSRRLPPRPVRLAPGAAERVADERPVDAAGDEVEACPDACIRAGRSPKLAALNHECPSAWPCAARRRQGPAGWSTSGIGCWRPVPFPRLSRVGLQRRSCVSPRHVCSRLIEPSSRSGLTRGGQRPAHHPPRPRQGARPARGRQRAASVPGTGAGVPAGDQAQGARQLDLGGPRGHEAGERPTTQPRRRVVERPGIQRLTGRSAGSSFLDWDRLAAQRCRSRAGLLIGDAWNAVLDFLAPPDGRAATA
jgi:hypothetical protein